MGLLLKFLEAIGIIAICWLPVLILALAGVAWVTKPEPVELDRIPGED